MNARIAPVLLFVSLAVACGDDDSGLSTSGTGGGTPACGTLEDPDLLTVSDVQPVTDSTVANADIVHAFTVVDAPGLFQSFTFVFPTDQHTAGSPSDIAIDFTVAQMGSDLRYEAEPISWQLAPGDVAIQVQERYIAGDGCYYAFPDPLFDYAITEAGEGGAGGGGAGGGGEGGGGGGGDGGAGGGGGG